MYENHSVVYLGNLNIVQEHHNQKHDGQSCEAPEADGQYRILSGLCHNCFSDAIPMAMARLPKLISGFSVSDKTCSAPS
jgi:hypothetical protein